MKDKALLQKLHSDPNIGMKLLMDQYAGLVWSVVRGTLSAAAYGASDVEECVADSFSEFYRDLAQYEEKRGSIKSWLCIIAVHNAIDYARKQQSHKTVVSLDDETLAAQYADSFSLEDTVIDRELRLALVQAIRAMGEPDRQILIRKFYLSQSSKEIAAHLNMTVSAVDVRTHRALNKLRERFGGKS